MRISKFSAWLVAGAVSLSDTLAMAAEEVAGRPVDGGMGLQRPVTEVARDLHWMDNFLLVILSAICGLVVVLLLIVIVRFNKRANPKPATFTHNALLEVVWTGIPVVILVIIAIPSLRLLFLELEVPEPDLTIKATGSQWYWSYDYPDQGIAFDSYMVGRGFSTWEDVQNFIKTGTDDAKDLKAEIEASGTTAQTWHLMTDTRVVVPVHKVVHLLVTGADVIHSWTIPSFGSKIDAIPGRVNETWFRVDETGTYFGQCSELCGKGHAYMPIVVQAVSQPDFDAWVAKEQAMNGSGSTDLAAAQ
jgi:cytochrome c oxidase subunit 2